MEQQNANNDNNADTKQCSSYPEDGSREGSRDEDDDLYTYRDFSHTKCSDLRRDSIHKQSPQKLPAKLNTILEEPELSSIITWLPHGRSWRVLDRDRFTKEVLPKHFDHSNFHSFVRLVNSWGFRRVPSGIDNDSYFHELFLRGMPHLHARMKRMLLNEKKAPIDSKDRCPNFYAMPPPDASAALNMLTENTGETFSANQPNVFVQGARTMPMSNPCITSPGLLPPQAQQINSAAYQAFPQLSQGIAFQALPAIQQQFILNNPSLMTQLLSQAAYQQQQNFALGVFPTAVDPPLQASAASINPFLQSFINNCMSSQYAAQSVASFQPLPPSVAVSTNPFIQSMTSIVPLHSSKASPASLGNNPQLISVLSNLLSNPVQQSIAATAVSNQNGNHDHNLSASVGRQLLQPSPSGRTSEETKTN